MGIFDRAKKWAVTEPARMEGPDLQSPLPSERELKPRARPQAEIPAPTDARSRAAEQPRPMLQVIENQPGQDHKAAASHKDGAQPAAPMPDAMSLAGIAKALGQAWQGWLGGLVAQTMQRDLVVLNMGCGDAALLGTQEGIHSTHAKSVRQQIHDAWQFTIVKELILSRQAMDALLERLAQVNQLMAEDRHLSVYDDWVRQAVLAKASDMHFSTSNSDQMGAIKLRIYGAIKLWRKCHSQLLLDSIAAAFGRRSKSASATRETFNAEVPVAFMTVQTIGGVRWEGRFNGRPYVNGYAGVMRLLDSEPRLDRIPTLEELGYTDSQRSLIQPAVLTNYGLIIIFGSTGSGKSTSLRTFLTRVMDPESVQIYTVENPAEYPMPNVIQFSLPVDVMKSSEEIQHNFTAVLRDTMRMDPDVGMVAELRDYETARLAAELTQTEHRCFTTCHGGGAVAGLSRLCGSELQMQPDTLAGPKFLSASIYQRLLPVLCPKCKLPASHPEHGIKASKQELLRNKYKLDTGTMFVANPNGCEHCKPKVYGLKGNGTLGVTVVAEILIPNSEIRAAILRRDWPAVESLWRDQRRAGFGEPDMRGKTAFEAALYKVSQGTVSLHSVEADFQPIETYEIRQRKVAAPGAVEEA